MNWSIDVVTAPAEEALTTTEAKAHLRVEHTDEDALIGAYSQAWREYLEERTNHAFVVQTLDYFRDEFPDGDDVIELPRGPVRSVSSVKYTSTTSTTAQTLSATTYTVDTSLEPARIALREGQSWPTPVLRDVNGVEVRYTAGFATSATGVPQRVKHTLRLLVGNSYTNRESLSVGAVVTKNPAAEAMIRNLDARRYL